MTTIGTLMGAAIRCDCGRQLTPSGGDRVLRCTCGRLWQALVHTRTTGSTAWMPSRGRGEPGAGDEPGSTALSVIGSIPLRPAPDRVLAGRNWRPRLV